MHDFQQLNSPRGRRYQHSLMRSTRVEKLALDLTAESFASEPSLMDIRPKTSSFSHEHRFKIKASKPLGRSPLFKSHIDPRSKEKGIMPPKRLHSLQLIKDSLSHSSKFSSSVSKPASPCEYSLTPPVARSKSISPQNRLPPFFNKNLSKECSFLLKQAPKPSQKKTTLVAFAFDPSEEVSSQAIIAAESLLDRWKTLKLSFPRLQHSPTPQLLAMKMKHQALQFQYFKAIFSTLYDAHPSSSFSRLLSPSEEDTYDDPTMVCNEILAWASENGFEGELKQADLRKGYGNENVIPLLSWMTSSSKIDMGALVRHADVHDKDTAEDEINSVPSNSEMSSIADDCHLDANFDDDEDQAVYDPVVERSFVMITPVTDPVKWRTELERISIRLRPPKSQVHGGDWRERLKAASINAKKISPDKFTEDSLMSISKCLSQEIEMLHSKQGGLMALPYVREFSDKFAALSNSLDEIRRQHKSSSSQFQSTLTSLEVLEEALKDLKTVTREQTDYMSDASVLTKMRVGIKKLKEETISMNLQLGIAETVIATKRIISEDSVG